MRDLTDQQAAFVTHYTSTPGAIGNAAEAARRSGYSEASARDLGHQLLNKPHIRAAVESSNRENLSGRLYTKAVGLLERLLDDETASAKVRLDAAKVVVDRVDRARAAQSDRGTAPAPADIEETRKQLAETLARLFQGRLLDGVIGFEAAPVSHTSPGRRVDALACPSGEPSRLVGT
jgi:phage terminase small subunit